MKKPKSRSISLSANGLAVSIATSLALCLGQTASAANYYWNTTTTGSWGTVGLWSDNATSGGTTGVAPVAADFVFFNQSSVNGAEVITLDADQSIAGITFNNTGTTTIQGNASGTTARALTLGTGGITVASTAGAVAFGQANGVVTIATGATTQTWTNNATSFTAGPVTGSGTLNLTGANSFTVNNIGQFSLGLSGYTGALNLTNARLVNSAATNGFGTTGLLTVNDGAQIFLNVASTTISRNLSIAGNGWYDNSVVQRGAIRFGTTGTISGNITLAADSRIVAAAAGILSGKITGGFGLEIGRVGGSETSTISLEGTVANDYSGLTTVSAGSLLLNKTGVNAIAGNVLVTSIGTLSNTASNQIADTSTVGVDISTAAWTLNGKTETIGTLNLSGAYVAGKGFLTGILGKLTVTNLNVSGGGVTLNSAGAGQDSTITANTVTNTGGTWVFGKASGTQSLVIGSGGLTIGGGSTMTVDSAATATTFISLGGNVISSANANSNVISTAGTNTGQLRLNATRTFDVADGGAASDLSISAILANGTGTGGIIKTGAGLMTLSGANTFTGSLTIKEGTLLSTASTAITTASSLILGDSTGVSTTPATFDMTTANVTYANAINVVGTNQVNTIKDSSFTLALSGPITLTNANLTLNQATSATMNVSGGVTGTGATQNLIISGSGTGGSLNLITAAVNNTGTITNNGSGTSPTNISSVIGTNVTGVTQNSATSTLTLSGANTYTSTTTIAAGILNAGIADVASTSGALGNGGNITFTGGRLQYSAASAGTDYSARIKNSSGAVAIDTNSQNVSFSGIIDSSNTLGLTKSGAGTLTLSGSNSYSGATSISAGIINIANNNALNGTSSVAVTSTVVAGGGLELANGVTVTGKSLTISGYGTGVRGSLRAASGATAEWAGPVVIGGASSPTDTRVGAMPNGTLTISGAISDGTLNTLIISGENAASVTPGKVIVSGTSNTYTGQTQIFRGILAIGADNALPTGTVLNVHAASSVTDAALFDLNGYNQQVAGLTRGNTSGAATVTNTGGTTKSLTISNTVDISYDSAISGNLALVKAGPAKQTLTGTNTYTGGTRIDSGTLTLGHATDTLANGGAVNVNGGTLDLGTNSDTVGAVTLTSGSITSTTGVLTGASYDVESGSISAVLAGPGTLTKTTTSNLTLSGNNTYSGGTAVNAGTATAGHVNAFGTQTITLATGATINLGGLAVTNNIINLGGTITGASNYAPTVAQSLSGTSSYTSTIGGTFNVATGGILKGDAATFTGAVTIQDGGFHSPGASPGTQTFSAGITYDNNSTLIWEFAGDTLASRGTNFDAVNVTGGDFTITAGAKLRVVNFSAVDYAATDWNSVRNFTVVDSSGGGDTLGNFTLDPTGDITIPGQGGWSVATTVGLDGDTLLTWTPVPEPSTYAAFAGLAALGLAWNRRRTKQNRPSDVSAPKSEI